MALRPLAGVHAVSLIDYDYRPEIENAMGTLLVAFPANSADPWRRRDAQEKAHRFLGQMRDLIAACHGDRMGSLGVFGTMTLGFSKSAGGIATYEIGEMNRRPSHAERRALRQLILFEADMRDVIAAIEGGGVAEIEAAVLALFDRVTHMERLRANRRLRPRLFFDGKMTTRGYRLTPARMGLLSQVDALARAGRFADILALLQGQQAADAIGRKGSWARLDHEYQMITAKWLSSGEPAWRDHYQPWGTIISRRGT